MTPEQLAAKLKSHSFASLREPLMQKIVLTLLRHAQLRTPVRSGTLRRSETTFVESGGLRGGIGTNIIYAPFVHAKQPFFQQAIDDGRGDVQKLLQQAGDEYFSSVVS
jgi:hypothetical protein